MKVERERKTVAVCVHCNSTFAHRKSLYKHERKFHGADYKKSVKENSKNHSAKRMKDNVTESKTIEDYACLRVS